MTDVEWRSERLKHVADVAFSSVDKKSVEGQIAVRLCNYTDVYYNDEITADLAFMDATASPDQVRAFGLRAGDVLITKDSETPDDIGVASFVPETLDRVVCGYHLGVLRPRKDRIDPRYLFWCMASAYAREQMSVFASGVTRYGLRFGEVANLRLAVPDLARQRSIAKFLDRETARIDDLTEAKRSLIALLSERLSALAASRVDTLSPVRVALRRVVEKFIDYRGATPSTADEGVPLVTAADIRNGRVDFTAERRFLSKDVYRLWMRRGYPEPGDVLLTTEAPLGETACVDDANIALAQRVILLRAKASLISNRFLLWYLRSPSAQSELVKRATGSTALGIKADRLRALPISVPDRQVQDSIAGELDAEWSRVVGVQVLVAAQIQRLTEHRQALISAAVKGQAG